MNPCKNNCTPNEKVCLGCGRNDEERANWGSYDEDTQWLIFHRATVRRLKRVLEEWERERE